MRRITCTTLLKLKQIFRGRQTTCRHTTKEADEKPREVNVFNALSWRGALFASFSRHFFHIVAHPSLLFVVRCVPFDKKPTTPGFFYTLFLIHCALEARNESCMKEKMRPRKNDVRRLADNSLRFIICGKSVDDRAWQAGEREAKERSQSDFISNAHIFYQ